MNEEERLKERIYKVVPSCSLHMMELLSIMEIKITSEISSAAVTIENRPTLLINKDFVDTYCKTDEHLLMLIMHELYHIILGHTRLFDCHSDIDNIALDAIINALLCRSFKDSDYTSFFTNINSDDKFPNCLLRPIGKNTPKKYIPFLNTLYNTEYGTYFEAYELIINNLKEGLINGDFILIGDHSKNGSSISNPIMKELLDKVISKWPRELVIRGRDLGGKLVDEKTTLEKIDKVKEKKMLKLLKESGVIDGNIISNKYRCNYIKTNALTFNPNYKDRTILSKTILYNNPILYNNEVTNYSLVKENPTKTLVYLDVSGSVKDEIKKIMPLLKTPYKNKECLLYVFSTVVENITYKDFMNGKYKTTGGTDINSIFKHYFDLKKKNQVKKILILTDGFVGDVKTCYLDKIKNKKIKIYCGLFGESSRDGLENIVKKFEVF